jgi:hypothetical protein
MIENVMDQDKVDELLVDLGRAICEREHTGIKPPSKTKMKEVAKRWLDSNKKSIEKAIRSNPKILDLAYNQRDRQILIATIADALSTPFVEYPVVTIATLIVHYGLDNFLEK